MDLKKEKIVALLAPSFVAEFDYPQIIEQLHSLGFSKVVELTFGAKMVNHEYHKLLENNKELVITSVCPGIVFTINNKYPEFAKYLAKIDSPMIATAKICKKLWPEMKTCFISPCNFKKQEAKNSKYIDYAIDYQELRKLVENIKPSKSKKFDKFYNEYTKIYPLSGGLSKTAHLKGVLKPGEEKIIDGILNVEKFLKHPGKVRFLDCTFCQRGCIGGPYLSNKNLEEKKKRVLAYLEEAKKQKIPKSKLGLEKKASGISFSF